MENIIGYTRDLKKVIVIEKINSKDIIVQEIYEADGNEFPSGEKFIVSEVFNEKPMTYKEKTLKNLEEDLDKRINILKDKNEFYRKKIDNETSTLSEILENYQSILKKITSNKLETLINFLTGKIKYVVIFDCTNAGIYDFIEFFNFKDHFGNIKLISLFGDSEGDLTYKINSYNDGSGGYSQVYFFTNKKEAKEKLQELILDANISNFIIKLAEEYNLKLDEEKLQKYKQKQMESINSDIKRKLFEAEKLKKELELINSI